MERYVVGRGRIGRWGTLAGGIAAAAAVVAAEVEAAVGGLGRQYADGTAAAPVVGLADVGDV